MNLLLNQLYAVDVVSYVSQKAVLQRRFIPRGDDEELTPK